MHLAVLCARGRDDPLMFLEIKLRPLHATDLGAALTGQQQDLKDRSPRCPQLLARAPEPYDLIVIEHAVALFLLDPATNAGRRVRLDLVLTGRPIEQRGQQRERAIGLNASTARPAIARPFAARGLVIEEVIHVGFRDRANRALAPAIKKIMLDDAGALAGQAGGTIPLDVFPQPASRDFGERHPL